MTLTTQDTNQDSTQDNIQEDNTVDDAIDGTSAEVVVARQLQVINAFNALNEAEVQIRRLHASVLNIRNMLPLVRTSEDKVQTVDVDFVPFAHVGKDVRNKMLANLYTNLEAVEDSIKASWRSTKNVKRTRLSEEQIDQLIFNSNGVI